jgi:hypothetical protein
LIQSPRWYENQSAGAAEANRVSRNRED